MAWREIRERVGIAPQYLLVLAIVAAIVACIVAAGNSAPGHPVDQSPAVSTCQDRGEVHRGGPLVGDDDDPPPDACDPAPGADLNDSYANNAPSEGEVYGRDYEQGDYSP
jgi:hypothetical protein